MNRRRVRRRRVGQARYVPEGRWYIFARGKELAIMDDWFAKYKTSSEVERKEPIYDAYSEPEITFSPMPGMPPGAPYGTHGQLQEVFYIFRVTAPTLWPPDVPLPTKAGKDVRKASDTSQRPERMTPADAAREVATAAAEQLTLDVGPILWIALGIYLLSKMGRN